MHFSFPSMCFSLLNSSNTYKPSSETWSLRRFFFSLVPSPHFVPKTLKLCIWTLCCALGWQQRDVHAWLQQCVCVCALRRGIRQTNCKNKEKIFTIQNNKGEHHKIQRQGSSRPPSTILERLLCFSANSKRHWIWSAGLRSVTLDFVNFDVCSCCKACPII